VAELVAEAQAEGALRTDADPVVLARLLFGTINSLTEWYDPSGPVGPDALADTILDFALGPRPL